MNEVLDLTPKISLPCNQLGAWTYWFISGSCMFGSHGRLRLCPRWLASGQLLGMRGSKVLDTVGVYQVHA